jgi:predicted RNase H-like nuclease
MPELIAIDIPIGLADSCGRECDAAARRMLRRRACCVFSAPIRPVLRAENHGEANRIRFKAEGKKMSAQAWGIVKKVRQVDQALSAMPALQVCAREVHPEVCFMAWNGGTAMSERKKSPTGKAARKRLVETHFGAGAFDKVRASYARRAVADDDINDAFAALWTAERILKNCAKFIPEQVSYDSLGLRMEMWY